MLKSLSAFLVRNEIWLAGALTGLGMLDTRLIFPTFVAILTIWPLRRMQTGAWSVRTPVDLPVILLVLLLPVNLWVSARPAVTLPQIWRILIGISLFYSIVNWTQTRRQLQILLWGTAAAGVFLSGFAFFSVDWALTKLPFIPLEMYENFSVLVQDSIHPNVLAGNLLLFAIVTGALILWNPSRSRFALLASGVLLLIIVGVLVISQARTSLLALGLAVLVLVTIRWRGGWLAVILAGIGLAWLSTSLQLSDLVDLITGDSVVDSFVGRIDIWARALFILHDFPLTGVGFGLIEQAITNFYPFFNPDPATIFHAHNLFLQVGVDLGLPGLVVWLAIFLSTGFAGWRSCRTGMAGDDGWLAAAGAAIVAVQFAVMFHGFFEVSYWGSIRAAPVLWAVWGVGIAALLQARQPVSSTS